LPPSADHRQQSKPQRPPRGALFAAAIVGVALLVACHQPSAQPATPVIAPTVPAVAPTTSPAENAPGTPEPTAVALQLWLPPDIARASVTIDGRTLLYTEALAEEAALPGNVQLVVTTKSLHGDAGLLESMLATAPVVPERLPHLILLDSVDLPALVEAGLVQPIAGLDEATYWDTLTPVAESAVTISGTRYGAPLCADLLLLAYDQSAVTTPPATWQALASGEATLLFPAAEGPTASDTLLALYLSAGGFVAESEPRLDTTALTRALSAYQLGREAGRIHSASVDTADADTSWAAYAAGKADMVIVTSQQLLQYGEDAPGTAIAPVPAGGAEPVTLARVLTWAIVSDDESVQDLALAYIRASAAPEAQRLLTARTFHLPVVASALDQESLGDWHAALSQQMASARPLPPFSNQAGLEEALAQAGASVLAGTAGPAEAANLAATKVSALK